MTVIDSKTVYCHDFRVLNTLDSCPGNQPRIVIRSKTESIVTLKQYTSTIWSGKELFIP